MGPSWIDLSPYHVVHLPLVCRETQSLKPSPSSKEKIQSEKLENAKIKETVKQGKIKITIIKQSQGPLAPPEPSPLSCFADTETPSTKWKKLVNCYPKHIETRRLMMLVPLLPHHQAIRLSKISACLHYSGSTCFKPRCQRTIKGQKRGGTPVSRRTGNYSQKTDVYTNLSLPLPLKSYP